VGVLDIRFRRLDLFIGALVVTSLALNTVLWLRSRPTLARPDLAAEARQPPRPARFSGAWHLPPPRLHAADPSMAREQTSLLSCQQRSLELESQLAELQRLRQRHPAPADPVPAEGRSKPDPGAVAGSVVLQTALHDFESSGAVERCQKEHSGKGTLDAHVSIVSGHDGDPQDEPAGVSIEASGPLAGTPLGNCIDGELRRALEAVPLPPRFERALVLAQYPKP